VIHKIGGKLVVAGNIPTTGDPVEMGKALSSANFQALSPKPAPAQSELAGQVPASAAPSPASTDAPSKS
jgi:hypothetical protein